MSTPVNAFPTSVSQDASGDLSWSNITALEADDGTTAGASLYPDGYGDHRTNKVTGTFPAFSLPAGAAVVGITLSVDYNATGTLQDSLGGATDTWGISSSFLTDTYINAQSAPTVTVWYRNNAGSPTFNGGFAIGASANPASRALASTFNGQYNGSSGSTIAVDALGLTLWYTTAAGATRSLCLVVPIPATAYPCVGQ